MIPAGKLLPEDISVEAYSTATVHKREKVEYWRDICSRAYADLELAPRDRSSFEGELRRSSAGPLSFVKVSSSAACITRSGKDGARSSDQRFELFLTLRGESVCVHNGRRAVLRPGDFTLVDISLPYSFEFEDVCSAVSLGIPKSLIGAYMPATGLYLGRPMSGLCGVNRLASVMIECLCDQVQSGQVTEAGPPLVRGVLDIVVTAYASAIAPPDSESAVAGARRVQIRAFIEANLRDPHLTPRQIAAALSISPRYLRLLFSQEDETISRYVTRRRLDEVTRELVDSRWDRVSITDLAYRWGFNDAAHFSRVFREHFGLSPRRYRQTRAQRS